MGISAIRHIATSFKGSKIAAATFERTVYIWDINSYEKISQFDTCLDFGGSRISISEDGSIIATGAYKRYGIATYRTRDGSLIWQRKDLEKVQYIKFEPWEGHLIACTDESGCHILNAHTGHTTKSYKGVIKAVPSFYHHNIIALERNKAVYISDVSTEAEKVIYSIRKETFSILAMVFTPNCLCISEAGGSLKCYCLESKSLLWRHEPPQGSHFLNLAYSEEMEMIYGILWAFEEGGNKEIYWFDTLTGEVQGRTSIAGIATETEFALGGNILITSDGYVYDLCGNQVPVIRTHLDFPK